MVPTLRCRTIVQTLFHIAWLGRRTVQSFLFNNVNLPRQRLHSTPPHATQQHSQMDRDAAESDESADNCSIVTGWTMCNAAQLFSKGQVKHKFGMYKIDICIWHDRYASDLFLPLHLSRAMPACYCVVLRHCAHVPNAGVIVSSFTHREQFHSFVRQLRRASHTNHSPFAEVGLLSVAAAVTSPLMRC